jgi:hypothetical protein
MSKAGVHEHIRDSLLYCAFGVLRRLWGPERTYLGSYLWVNSDGQVVFRHCKRTWLDCLRKCSGHRSCCRAVYRRLPPFQPSSRRFCSSATGDKRRSAERQATPPPDRKVDRRLPPPRPATRVRPPIMRRPGGVDNGTPRRRRIVLWPLECDLGCESENVVSPRWSRLAREMTFSMYSEEVTDEYLSKYLVHVCN